MAKIKLNKDMEDVPVVDTPVEAVDTPVEAVDTPVEVVKNKVEEVFPVVKGNGKFHSVVVGEQFAVYNPDGQRVTGLVSFSQANDIVRQQNQAASIKG